MTPLFAHDGQVEVVLDGELVNHVQFLEQGTDSLLPRIPGEIVVIIVFS